VHPPALIDAHAVRRASVYLQQMRHDLAAARPPLADSTRCYFWGLAYNIGFQVADGPAVRVWTGNPTLQGFYINDYVTSASRPSRFFRGDSLGGLHEVRRGKEEVPAAAADPSYATAHVELGSHLYRAGETAAGRLEWRKALRAEPGNPEAMFDLGAALVEADSGGAAVLLLDPLTQGDAARPEALYFLGKGLAQSGRLMDARVALGRLLARFPTSEYAASARRLLSVPGPHR